ncbi:hypothetical protein ACFL4C_01480 [Candidatus Omnitrophota bacterium]
MALENILNLALRRQQDSIELYTDLLDTFRKFDSADRKIEDLFLFLIKEQDQSKQRLLEKIENLYFSNKN